MQKFNKPNKEDWAELTQRPVINQEQLTQTVSSIINDVKQTGDKALIKCASLFDGVELSSLGIAEQEIAMANKQVSQELKEAIETAYNNIYSFHKAQQLQENVIETTPGVKCWRKKRL